MNIHLFLYSITNNHTMFLIENKYIYLDKIKYTYLFNDLFIKQNDNECYLSTDNLHQWMLFL